MRLRPNPFLYYPLGKKDEISTTVRMGFPYNTVLIVGCTAGIGLALAERMIENGIFVIAVGRRQERLDAFVAKHGSDKAAASQFDITKLDDIQGWVKK